MIKKDKIEEIYYKHGVSNQLKKLSEEVYELQEAVKDFNSARKLNKTMDSNYKEHIEEEFSDVILLLTQIKLVYNLDNDNLRKWFDFKLKRQIARDKLNVKK